MVTYPATKPNSRTLPAFLKVIEAEAGEVGNDDVARKVAILNAGEIVLGNGSLFAEHLRTADFDQDMREILIECCALDWGRISPAIFGALFQSVMKKELRRNLGAHYTTEKNILKLIGPLFLDELRAESRSSKAKRKSLPSSINGSPN